MAANAQRAPLARGRRIFARGLSKLRSTLEPWYDWGTIHVERLQELRLADGQLVSGGEGPVPYFVVQWFGLHLQVQIGRTPKREG